MRSDVEEMRLRFKEACMKYGLRLVVRKRIMPSDNLPKCSRCYDDVYKDSEQWDCPVCFGTGFTGGYHAPVLTWGEINLGNVNWTDNEKAGVFPTDSGSGYMEHTPLLREGDLLWSVMDYEDIPDVGWVPAEGETEEDHPTHEEAVLAKDLVEVKGDVNVATARGRLRNKSKGETDTDASTDVSQRFSVIALPPNDPRQQVAYR